MQWREGIPIIFSFKMHYFLGLWGINEFTSNVLDIYHKQYTVLWGLLKDAKEESHGLKYVSKSLESDSKCIQSSDADSTQWFRRWGCWIVREGPGDEGSHGSFPLLNLMSAWIISRGSSVTTIIRVLAKYRINSLAGIGKYWKGVWKNIG